MRKDEASYLFGVCKLIEIGDEKALTKFIDFFSSGLFFFALGFVRKREVAEEIVSDVFVQIWEDRKNIMEIINIKSYLYILVRNLSITHLRTSKNDQLILMDTISDFYLSELHAPDHIDIEEERLAAINKAISALPARCKMVFILAKVNGLKYREISEIMNISVKTIDNQIAYALDKICNSVGVPRNNSLQLSKIISALFFAY